MEYEVRILRGPNWWENEGYEISEAEWQRVVEANAAMRMSRAAEAAYPEGVLQYESPNLAEWQDTRADTLSGSIFGAG